MKNITVILISFAFVLSISACSEQFMNDCKRVAKGVKVKVEPPEGCDENEML